MATVVVVVVVVVDVVDVDVVDVDVDVAGAAVVVLAAVAVLASVAESGTVAALAAEIEALGSADPGSSLLAHAPRLSNASAADVSEARDDDRCT